MGPMLIAFSWSWGGIDGYSWVCYIAPNDASLIERVISFIIQIPHGAVLLVDSNFNSGLDKP